MADDRKTDEPFLQRWARRKADAANPAAEPTAAETSGPETPGVDMRTTETAALPQSSEAPPDVTDEEPEEIDLSTLPDIESLGADSDFSVFMRNGIPEELQKRALQKLWRLDPAFGHIDGLLEYGEDFTGSGLVAEAVNTVYKVGKDMRTEDAEDTEREAGEAIAEGGAEDSAVSETAVADDRPATSEAASTENADEPENASANDVKPDRVARRCDPPRDQ